MNKKICDEGGIPVFPQAVEGRREYRASLVEK